MQVIYVLRTVQEGPCMPHQCISLSKRHPVELRPPGWRIGVLCSSFPSTLGESPPAALSVLENSQHCENGRAKPETILQPSAWLAASGTGEG